MIPLAPRCGRLQLILDMPAGKHKHDTSRASRCSSVYREHSFASVTDAPQIIPAAQGKVASACDALYKMTRLMRRNFMRASAAQEHVDG